MREVLENLKNNQILYNQNILDIKSAILVKYPHFSPKEAAFTFAGMVHKIVDKHITEFEPAIQTEIKSNLFQTAVKNDNFDLSAYDVLMACSKMDLNNKQHLDDLTSWMNTKQNIPVSAHEVMQVAKKLQNPTDYVTASVLWPAPLETFLSVYVQSDFLLKFKSFMQFIWLKLQNKRKVQIGLFASLVGICTLTLGLQFGASRMYEQADNSTVSSLHVIERIPLPEPLQVTNKPIKEHPMPSYLHYKEIDTHALRNWLSGRNSILAEEPYFGSMLEVAKEYDINPLLLFAITGQEQSFVPKSHQKALKMANNPFNVYGSWQSFNTDISDTSRIAAKTLLNLSKERPQDEDPIKWINRKYAEDPDWHIGVSQIYQKLESIAGDTMVMDSSTRETKNP